MDLIGYDEKQFKKLEKQIKKLAVDLDLFNVKVIPVSATEGDNITKLSGNMPWYQSDTLLAYLENVDVTNEEETGFVMPVQRVCRPNHTFRGFQGQIESGEVAVGEELQVLPSGEKAHVASILVGDKNQDSAFSGQPVTIQLDREIDVSRGCVLKKDTELKSNNMFTASLLWMDDENLAAGKNFQIKIGTKLTNASIMSIKYKIDVNTGEHIATSTLRKNEIAECDIALGEEIVYDNFAKHRGIGSFILIDRISNMTSACGTILHSLRRSENITWQQTDITRQTRAEHMMQKPLTLWFTGLSGSGKSTLANEMEKLLNVQGKYTMMLDGDNIRMGLNKNLGFKEEDRIENIRRIAEVSKLMNDAGLIVLTSFISPYASDRENARAIVGNDNFIEIYVSTPLEECERRDVKGLYKKARKGEIPNFTGISSKYEVPKAPQIEIDTSKYTLEEAVDYLANELKKFMD